MRNDEEGEWRCTPDQVQNTRLGGQKVRMGFPVTSYGKTQTNFLTKPKHILREETKRKKKKKKEEPVNSLPKQVPTKSAQHLKKGGVLATWP